MAWSAGYRSAPSRCGGGWTRISGPGSPGGSASPPTVRSSKPIPASKTPRRRPLTMRIADSLSRRSVRATLIVIALLLATGSWLAAREEPRAAMKQVCADDNGGSQLPAGICANVLGDNIGRARHLVVAPNGVVYVNTWSGRYYGNDTPPAGGFLVALQDTTGDGRADVNIRFGDSVQSASAGGTGIALYNGALFAAVDDRIVRYA